MTVLRTLAGKQNNDRTSEPLRTSVAHSKSQQRPPRTNGSTRRRRSDARDPGTGHTPRQHSPNNPGKKLTFRHRVHCQPAMCHTELAQRRRRRSGRAVAHIGAAPTQEDRAQQAHALGTSQDNTMDITLQSGRSGGPGRITAGTFRDTTLQDTKPCEDHSTQYHIQEPV